MLSHGGFECGAALLAFFDELVFTQHQALAVHHTLCATPDQGGESFDGGYIACQSRRNGFGHGVVRAACQAGGQAAHGGFIRTVPGLPGDQLRFAFGQRAGFVQRHGFQQAGLFQVGAALDQNAAPGSKCQAADHGDRGGYDQRTWAGDHQQNQRLVQRGHPGPAQQRRGEQGHGQRHHKHGGGVDGGKTVDDALGGRTGALGFFDGMDDARQQGVAGSSSDTEFQLASLVDSACKQRVTGGLLNGNTLAGDGRLVHGTVAFADGAVQRNTLTGAHAHSGL